MSHRWGRSLAICALVVDGDAIPMDGDGKGDAEETRVMMANSVI
jgi:hypothetical protein